MGLSDQERQALREIEASLLADDPKFGQYARSETSEPEQSSGGRLTLQGIALVAVGLTLLVSGVALAQNSLWFIALSIFGFFVMFGSGIWMLRGGGKQHAPRAVPRGGRAMPKPNLNKGNRMNDSFRKRFEN